MSLKTGQDNAIGVLDKSAGLYGGLAGKYGAATTLGLDALGVNGPGGNDRATAAFRQGQAISTPSIRRWIRQSARPRPVSMDIGGNTLAALSDRAGNMADQSYQTVA
jgi:hypothetical protein